MEKGEVRERSEATCRHNDDEEKYIELTFMACLLHTGRHAKDFEYTISFNPHGAPMRQVPILQVRKLKNLPEAL